MRILRGDYLLNGYVSMTGRGLTEDDLRGVYAGIRSVFHIGRSHHG